jgi:hypothetical protein
LKLHVHLLAAANPPKCKMYLRGNTAFRRSEASRAALYRPCSCNQQAHGCHGGVRGLLGASTAITQDRMMFRLLTRTNPGPSRRHPGPPLPDPPWDSAPTSGGNRTAELASSMLSRLLWSLLPWKPCAISEALAWQRHPGRFHDLAPRRRPWKTTALPAPGSGPRVPAPLAARPTTAALLLQLMPS